MLGNELKYIFFIFYNLFLTLSYQNYLKIKKNSFKVKKIKVKFFQKYYKIKKQTKSYLPDIHLFSSRMKEEGKKRKKKKRNKERKKKEKKRKGNYLHSCGRLEEAGPKQKKAHSAQVNGIGGVASVLCFCRPEQAEQGRQPVLSFCKIKI